MHRQSKRCCVCFNTYFRTRISNDQWEKSRFCSLRCFGVSNSRERSGANAPRWAGGVQKHSSGYLVQEVPGHPYAKSRDRVFQHRLVMEKHLGRYLLPSEVVHHKNGVKNDNRIENLEILTPHQHMTHHAPKPYKWSAEIRAKALALAEIVGKAQAARTLKIPVGTVSAWRTFERHGGHYAYRHSIKRG